MANIVKPDDYLNNGLFEMARFGNQTIIKNNMLPDEFEKWQNYFTDNFQKKKN